jgi:hypothetical protein
VATIIPPNVLPILSSNVENSVPSRFTPRQGRMSTVFSIPSNLVLPYLTSLSPVAVMALGNQRPAPRSAEYQGWRTRSPICPFPSFPRTSQPLTTVSGTEKANNIPRRLNYDGAVVNKLQRPRTAPTVATDHAVDLASSFSAVIISTNQPVWGVGDPSAPRSGLCHVGEFAAATWRKHAPLLGNMILSSCPGKKVRLTGELNHIPSCRCLVLSHFPHIIHYQFQQ